VCRVIDDGPGIPESDHARIFERFYRAETEATRRNQGSGLGLPIARATAELHRGQLTVATTPGGGATFSLRLPLRRKR
jgi:signal transduction histidine kinase